MLLLQNLRRSILKFERDDFKKYIKQAREQSIDLNQLIANPRKPKEKFTLLDSCYLMLQTKYRESNHRHVRFALSMIWELFQSGVDFSRPLSFDQHPYMQRSNEALLRRSDDNRYLQQRRLFTAQEILRCFAEYHSHRYPNNAHILIGAHILSSLGEKKFLVEKVKEYHGYQADEEEIDYNGSQTAHYKSAHEAAGQAISRLQNRYKDLDVKDTLLSLHKDLTLLHDISLKRKLAENVTTKKINCALRYLDCIPLIPIESNTYDKVTHASQEVYFAFIWHALKQDYVFLTEDNNWIHLGEQEFGTDWYESRLCMMVNELVNICRAYNTEVDEGDAFKADQDLPNSFDNPTCWGGIYTKAHSVLMGKHPDVPIEYLSFSHRDLASLRKEIFGDVFNNLSARERAEIRHLWITGNPYDIDDFLKKNENGLFSKGKISKKLKKKFTPVMHSARDFIIEVNHRLRDQINQQYGIQGERPVAVVPKDVANQGVSIFALASEELPPQQDDEIPFAEELLAQLEDAPKTFTPSFKLKTLSKKPSKGSSKSSSKPQCKPNRVNSSVY